MKASPGGDQRLLGRPEFSGGRPSHRRWRDAPDAAHPAAAIDQKPRQLMAPHQVITENEQAILVRRKQSSASCGRRSPADHLTLKAYEQGDYGRAKRALGKVADEALERTGDRNDAQANLVYANRPAWR